MATEFTSLPTVEELVKASDHIDERVADQMLLLVEAMLPETEQQVKTLNSLIHTLETAKHTTWDDVRWAALVGWIGVIQQAVSGKSFTGDARDFIPDNE